MKKLVFLITLAAFISCQEKAQAPPTEEAAEVNQDMARFQANIETHKAFLQAFCDKDSVAFFSHLTDDFIWSPPSVGQDSLPREAFEEAMRGFWSAYTDIEFTDGQYFAGLNDDQTPSGDVRAYGMWKSKFADSGKDARLKWYGVAFFTEDGKISHWAEWYDTADLTKVYEGDD